MAKRRYKIGTVFAFGLQLGMSKFLIQKAINWLMVIDVPKLGLNLEEVAFCVCGVVVNQNAEERYSDDPLYNPHRNDENNPETFVQLVNRIIERFERASMTRIQSCWGKLTQSELPERKAQHWRQTVEEEALVPLLPPETRRHFTAKELDE